MDEELKQYLDTKFSAMDAKFDAKFSAIDTKFSAIDGKLDRAAEAFAGEVGSLHTQIKDAEERIIGQIEVVDARQRHDAGLTTTLMELVLKQTRWHEKTDNAVADLTAKNAEFSRRLGDLGKKAS